jgi:hypothetical protein
MRGALTMDQWERLQFWDPGEVADQVVCVFGPNEKKTHAHYEELSKLLDTPPVPTSRTSADLRAEFLDVVKGYVTKDRAATHGDAEDNFADIADLWNIVFGDKLSKPFEPRDVATAMICVKLSRIKKSPNNLDNWHDTAGYASCGGGIIMKKAL